MTKKIIEMTGLYFKYKFQKDWLLKNANLLIVEGENIGIIGPNGCGKSTIAKLIMGIFRPKSGEIKLLEMECNWNIHYPNVGYIGDPGYTTEELGLPGRMRVGTVIKIITQLHRSNAQHLQEELFTKLDIKNLQNKYIDELSTGQRKRLMACITLLRDPDILILDEPFDGLDKGIKKYLLNVLSTYRENPKKTILLISHDKVEIDTLSDRVYEIRNGELLLNKQQIFNLTIKTGIEEVLYEIKAGEALGLIFDKMEECVNTYTSLNVTLIPTEENEKSR